MTNVQVGLVVISIISFSMGIWPIGIASLGALIYISKTRKPEQNQKQKTIEELEKENEALRAELAEQAVQRAMDRAEKRD